MELEKISAFRSELAIAETIEDIKHLETKASAIAEIARKQKTGKSAQDEVGAFRCDIESKKGAWLDEFYPSKAHSSSPMADEGIGFKESSNARLVSKEQELVAQAIDELKQDDKKVVTPNAVVSLVRNKKRKEKIEKQKEEIINNALESPTGDFDVIVMDPPWDYSEKGGFSYKQHDFEGNRGGVDYSTMSINDIKNIKLPAKNDSVLFLWTTHAFLKDSFSLLDEWEYNYKATIVWDKVNMGMGRVIRLQCEFCLLATIGNPIISGESERDIITEKRREHSRKPEAFYDMVERMCVGRKLDYFSREDRKEWSAYGAETNKF